VTRDEVEGRGAVLWALASLLVVAAALALGLGCATGRVMPDGEMVCAAIGEDAKVSYSHPTGEAGMLTSAPAHVVTCEGGPLMPSLLDGVGTVLTTAGKVLWGWMTGLVP